MSSEVLRGQLCVVACTAFRERYQRKSLPSKYTEFGGFQDRIFSPADQLLQQTVDKSDAQCPESKSVDAETKDMQQIILSPDIEQVPSEVFE